MPVEVIKNKYTVVYASESIDLDNAEEFHTALQNALTDSSRGLIIDLSDAIYIDSAGIQAIIGAYQRIHSLDARMALVVANQNMRDLIGIVNLDMLPGVFMCEDMVSAEDALKTGEEC